MLTFSVTRLVPKDLKEAVVKTYVGMRMESVYKIEFPKLTMQMVPTSSWSPEYIYLKCGALQIGNAYIGTMYGNCGIRQIGGVWIRPESKEYFQWWMDILEDMTKAMGFSYLVATCGSSSGWPMKKKLEQCTGWTVIPLDKNQRQCFGHTIDTLALMHKYLDRKEPRKINIDWTKGTLA